MSILYDTKTHRKFIDHKLDFEDRAIMYKKDPERIYECCCKEYNRVQLKLSSSLHFYPITKTQTHDCSCERSSVFQEDYLYNRAFRKREDGTYIAQLDYKNDFPELHNNVDREFPTIEQANPTLSFASFAKKINMIAYSKMMKTYHKDKNGNHLTIDEKNIERYIWSVLQSVYVLHDGKEISIFNLEKQTTYKYRHNYHLLDPTRDIKRRATKTGLPYYVIPILNFKGFGSNQIVITSPDFTKAKEDFESFYKIQFNSKNHNIMMFAFGEKNHNSDREINPWKTSKICFFLVSQKGLYSDSPQEALIYSKIENLLAQKEKEGKHLQFYKPYDYQIKLFKNKKLPNGIIQSFPHSNKIILLDISKDKIQEHFINNSKILIWKFSLHGINKDFANYLFKKINELSDLINRL